MLTVLVRIPTSVFFFTVGEIDLDGLEDVVAKAGVEFLVNGSVRHDVPEALYGIFEVLLGGIEVLDDDPSDFLSVVV